MCGLSTVVTPAGASLTMYREIRSYANSIWDDNNNNNENRIGEGGRGTKKRKKPQKSCRRRAGNRGDMGGKRKKCTR